MTTALLHGLLAGAIVLAGVLGDEGSGDDAYLDIVFDQVELLALGDEKAPQELPRIANPEPAPAVEEPEPLDAPPPEPVEEPPPVVEEPVPDPSVPTEAELERQRQEERERERKRREEEARAEQEARQRRMNEALNALHNPNRPTNDDLAAGSRDGVAGGTVSDAALANMMGTYQARLLQEISRYWEVPTTITDAERNALKGQVWVYVRLSESGHIVTFNFRRQSENEQFNASIERVLKRFQVQFGGRTLPLPDNPEVRRAVIARGLELKTWDSVGR